MQNININHTNKLLSAGQETSKCVSKIHKIDCTEKIEEFHLGSEHGYFITESRSLYSWGWNEHGNCGNGSTENL